MGAFYVFLTFLRVIALVQFLYGIYFDVNDVMPDHMKGKIYPPGFGGKLRFLTVWSLVS